VFEIPDREVLVVSADVSPQAGETDEQHIQYENANAARDLRRHEEINAAAAAVSVG
jgi:hypothetical protein